MSQVSYGTITVSDLTDITNIYLQYCMAADTYTTAAAIEAKTTWITPEVNWFTLSNDTIVNSNKIYYELDNNIYFIVHPSGSENPKSNNWYEDSVYPTWQSGYQIWVRQVTIKEGINQPEYGTPYLDKAINQTNNNVINLSDKLKAFFHPGDSSYSGAFVVGKTSEQGLDTADATTYGWNTRVATSSISMGYNKIPLVELGLLDNGSFTGLKLYSPIFTNSEVTDHRLDASLTSNGLVLSKGGIEAGTKNTQDYIYIYSSDDNTNHRISINNSGDKADWRIIAGDKFGVDKTGYMSAASGKIGGWSINSTSLYSLNKTEWDKDAEGIFIGSHTDEDDATRTIFTISGGKRQYVKTEDIEVNEEQTYYRLVNDEYEEVPVSEISEGTNPKSNDWYISLGPMWYINSDGSASFGSLLVNQSGSLDVPAASISGKLTADQIEVNNLGAISANIGSTINSETTSNSFEVNSEKKIINSLDTKIVDKKEYIGEIPKPIVNELEDYPTGQDYLLETDDTASYILHRTPVNNADLTATFYCNTTEEGATKIFQYGTEDTYIFNDTDGLIWIEYDGQTTFTIHDGFNGTRLINIVYNADQTIDTSLQEIVEESFIKLNTHKSNYNLTKDSTRGSKKIYYEFNPDYVLTDDEEVKENTRYYIQNINGDNVSYSLVETPLSNPKENNYYELHPKYTINDGTGNPSNSNLYEVTSEYSGGIVLQEGSVSILSNEQIVAKTDETNSALNLYDIELIGQMDVGNLRIMSHDNGLVVTIGD